MGSINNSKTKDKKNNGVLSREEQKQVLLGLLVFFDKVCRDNDIRYSLIGGSLIGAIRHKGFIPWDDDIDVIMMPKEYQKLVKILRKPDGCYKLLTPGSSKAYRYPYSKLVDTRTVVEEMGYKTIDDYGVFLDVFCYHYLPDNSLLRKMKCGTQVFLKKMFAVMELDPRSENGVLKKVLYLPSKLVPTKMVKKIYAKMCDADKPTSYLISNWPAYGVKRETQLVKNTDQYRDVHFETANLMAFAKYDDILRNTYGDYMKLPSREKRVSPHKMTIKWRDDVKR